MTTDRCQCCRTDGRNRTNPIRLWNNFTQDPTTLLCMSCHRRYRLSKQQKLAAFAFAILALAGVTVCSLLLKAPLVIKTAGNALLLCLSLLLEGIVVRRWLPWQEDLSDAPHQDPAWDALRVGACPYCEAGRAPWRQTLSWSGRDFRAPYALYCTSCGHRYERSRAQKGMAALWDALLLLLTSFLLAYSFGTGRHALGMLLFPAVFAASYMEHLTMKWLPWKGSASGSDQEAAKRETVP